MMDPADYPNFRLMAFFMALATVGTILVRNYTADSLPDVSEDMSSYVAERPVTSSDSATVFPTLLQPSQK